MTKFLCLLLLVWPLVACNDIVEFLNDRPPCSDSCKKKPGFQNCQNCKCKPGQEAIEDHVCCQGGSCIKPPAAIDPHCMNPADGRVYLAVYQPISIPDQPDCGDNVEIRWGYFNTSTGTLKPSTQLNLPVPFLNLHEQTTPESTDTIYNNQGWPELASCGEFIRSVFAGELIPQARTPSNFIAQVRQLPENTTGTDYFGFTVNANLNNPKCPQP